VSNSASASAASGGISMTGLLGVILVVMKAMGWITWPWLWVLAPFWIPFIIFVLVSIVTIVILALK
jgi:hypothetical protein